MAQAGEFSRAGTGRRAAVLLALMAFCLLVRASNLGTLPIFGDESIYLRWAQLVRGEGVAWGGQGPHLWVSLADPKPPLHFWLLALVFHWASDPLVAARFISVAAGVAGVPLMVWLGEELGCFMRPRAAGITGRGVGMLAAVLWILCPFLSFYQRLATADALFTTEALLAVWLSLRWSRALAEGKRSAWAWATGLGVTLGAGLMTRQGVSYTLCAMPWVAWLAQALWRRADDAPAAVPPGGQAPAQAEPAPAKRVGVASVRGLIQFLLIALVAGACWTPYLVADLHDKALLGRNGEVARHDLSDAPEAPVTHAEMWKEVKRRIFYQEAFSAGTNRAALAARNLRLAFAPMWRGSEPSSGWLYFYMTPPLFGLALAGLIVMAVRQPRAFVLVAAWGVLLLAPVLLMASVIYSRYVLAGVPAMLVGAAYLLAEVTAALVAGFPRRPIVGTGLALCLWGILIVLPLTELQKQLRDWPHQTMTVRGEAQGDKYQYINGWTAGYASRDAVKYLQAIAKDGPIVVITTDGWGTPADAVWVYLSGRPNVQVYFTDAVRVLRPGREAGTYVLKDDKWLFPPERAVRFAEGARVYFVANDPVHAREDVPAAAFYGKENPNLGAPRTFHGVDGADGESVVVFPVAVAATKGAER